MTDTLITIEEQITRKLITALLAAFPDQNIVVDDEEGDITDAPTRDADEIFEACRAVDMARVSLEDGRGWVMLVNGNGEDVISDYTTDLEDVLAPLNDEINAKFG